MILILMCLLFFAGNNNEDGVPIDDKSKQWFGASVHSSGPDGVIVVRFWTFILYFILGRYHGISFFYKNYTIYY